jgi:2-hydroxychromene-2-carboxylate isomerase
MSHYWRKPIQAVSRKADAMSKTVECFYTLSSPWMYLGNKQLSEIIKRHGATLVLRPYDFRLVVPHAGGIPLRTRPEPRQDYHALELDRWALHLGIPIKLKPKHYPPSDQRPAGHMVMAAAARDVSIAVTRSPDGSISMVWPVSDTTVWPTYAPSPSAASHAS